MRNINFVQGGQPLQESNKLARKIRAMGGCARKDVDEKTHFLGSGQKKMQAGQIFGQKKSSKFLFEPYLK